MGHPGLGTLQYVTFKVVHSISSFSGGGLPLTIAFHNVVFICQTLVWIYEFHLIILLLIATVLGLIELFCLFAV